MKNWTILGLLLGMASASFADVVLPKIMGSHMILQRGVQAPIWGWADQGEAVTVEFAGQSKQAQPDASGKWMVNLDPLIASAEPRAMTIRGQNKIVLQDVLVGEVWLASGQSNMEWTFQQIAAAEKVFAATHKDNQLVRVFHVDQHITEGVPLDDTVGKWKLAAEILKPPMRSVSAVGFFFALELQAKLGVPVAILDANWGGRRIEPFIPDEGFKALGLNFQSSGHESTAIIARLDQLAKAIADTKAAVEKGRRPLLAVNTRIYGWAENDLYNAMIAPMASYGIKGAIWYQGESNRGAPDYFQKLQALSAGWSTVFNVKDIPLYQVQIAPYAYNRGNLDDATLSDTIWAAQYKGAKEIPGMGVVAIHDTKIDIFNIHPVFKRTVGERLAAQALKNQYGHDVVTTGPRFASATAQGATAIVSFSDIDQGLITNDGAAPTWFELSADGKVFVKAEAVIEGATVKVTAAGITTPTHVRMGWKDIAIPNLADKNGWPVFSFPAKAVTAQ